MQNLHNFWGQSSNKQKIYTRKQPKHDGYIVGKHPQDKSLPPEMDHLEQRRKKLLSKQSSGLKFYPYFRTKFQKIFYGQCKMACAYLVCVTFNENCLRVYIINRLHQSYNTVKSRSRDRLLRYRGR